MADMSDDESNQIGNGLEDFGDDEMPELSIGHPDKTPDCLPLDRIFTATGLEKLEKDEADHLENCEFCQRLVKSFEKIPLELRQPVPYVRRRIIIRLLLALERWGAAAIAFGAQVGVAVGTRVANAVRNIWPQPVRQRWATAVVLLIVTTVAVGAGVIGVSKIRELLAEAAVHQARLTAIEKATGLETAIELELAAEQPNIAKLVVNINPMLIRHAAVTYHNGERWTELYDVIDGGRGGGIAPGSSVRVEDKRALTVPEADGRTVTAWVRVQYSPEVVRAFPEYSKPVKTDRTGIYRITPQGIVTLSGKDPESARPVILMASVPLVTDRWEVVHSLGATASLAYEPVDGGLIQHFVLDNIGQYVNLSHAVPGASASSPTVSLEELETIEIEFLWDGEDPLALEPKLVDDHGKTVGITKFIEPEVNTQTIRVPARSLKGYWGVRSFDYSRVRRTELAVARKASDHAAKGTFKIRGIKLFGTGKRLLAPPPPHRDLLMSLSLSKETWRTAQNKQARIELSSEEDLLLCKVELPYDEHRHEELPWTNLKTDPDQHDFRNLEVIELEIMWKGPAAVTIEPKLVTSENEDTYGLQRWVQPGESFQKLSIRPEDLKYYWSVAGTRDTTAMDLGDLRRFSLGIARKAKTQAGEGVLYIKAIRLMGRSNKKAGKQLKN